MIRDLHSWTLYPKHPTVYLILPDDNIILPVIGSARPNPIPKSNVPGIKFDYLSIQIELVTKDETTNKSQ